MDTITKTIIITAIIAFAGFMILLGPFRESLFGAKKVIDPTTYLAKVNTCKIESETKAGDIDPTDGLLISCKTCIGGKEIDEKGKIIDADNDGLADDCDKNPQKAGDRAKECEGKGTWDKKEERCCLKSFEKYCTVSK